MDWTPVLTAGVTGLATGLVGYSVASLQARMIRAQASEETKRMQLQHGEEARRLRQATYQDMLKALRDFDALMVLAHQSADQALTDWFDVYSMHRAGVDLVGSTEVTTAMDALASLQSDISRTAVADSGGGTTIARNSKAYSARREEVVSLRRTLLGTMRADLGAAGTG